MTGGGSAGPGSGNGSETTDGRIAAGTGPAQAEAWPTPSETVAVVTGASRGIGREIARALGARGCRVVAIARTVGGLEELDDEIRAQGGPSATLVPFDLRDGAGIDRLGAALKERHGGVHVVVGAAAVLSILSPVAHTFEKDWSEALAVNATANFRLLRTLDPLLQRVGPAMAVFLTCAGARERRAFWAAHAASKAALEALVEVYAAEVANRPITVKLFDPGPTRTAHRRRAFPGEDPSKLPSPADAAAPLIADLEAFLRENGLVRTSAPGGPTGGPGAATAG